MKVRIYLTLLISFLSVISCKDQLDEIPYSSLSAEAVFANEEGLKRATYGVYQNWTGAGWPIILSRFILSETSHQYAMPGLFGTGYFDPFYEFGYRPDTGQPNQSWTLYFQVVSRANTVIANADKAVSNPDIANGYKAEARFLRAYAYFNLVRNFGGVPIVDQEITSLTQKDLIFGARKTTEETYNFIVEDLQYAEANLPDQRSGVDVGRVTAGVAKAMLGKVYLHMAGKPLEKTEYFKKAADKLLEVVDANEAKYNFGLMDNFPDVFALENEHNKEILLSFSSFYTPGGSVGSIYPFFFIPDGFLAGDGQQTIYGLSYPFYELFEAQDTRRDFTVIERYEYKGGESGETKPGDMIVYDPDQWAYINDRTGNKFGNATTNAGLAYAKLARVARPAGSTPWDYSTDLIELRFSDVLLCLAEALTEDGRPGEALPYLNRVRARAQASPSNASGQAAMRDAVRLERRLELTGEFTTVYDIRRWGTLQQEMAAMAPEQIRGGVLPAYHPRYEIYPIPQQQINANPNLEQTEVWK